MKKRFIALFVIFAMLVPLTPAVAADDNVPRPTVEEILSEYHQKAFEAEAAGETATASTYSRSGSSGKTLEQETVDTLNAAGYEAYNVTAENFEALEAQLQTDFDDMGLDPNGSYIITISGEDSENSNASGISPRAMVPYPIEGGGGFSYTYNGKTYSMRYVTVTYVDKPALDQMFAFSVKRSSNKEIWEDVLDAAITFAIEEVAGSFSATKVGSLSKDLFAANQSILDCNGFLLTGSTTWTLQYIQVYDSSDSQWVASQCSEYAVTSAQTQFYLYDITLETHIPQPGELFSCKTYSKYYNNATYRKNCAVQSFASGLGVCSLDYTGDIRIGVTKEDTNTSYYIGRDINNDSDISYIFVRNHWTKCD